MPLFYSTYIHTHTHTHTHTPYVYYVLHNTQVTEVPPFGDDAHALLDKLATSFTVDQAADVKKVWWGYPKWE